MSEFSDTAEAVTTSILDALQPRLLKNDDGREWLLTPDGERGWTQSEVTLVNAIEPIAPKIITQAVKVQDVSSFSGYVDRFKNSNSVLFADIVTSTILGVIDYHRAPVEIGEAGLVAAPTAEHTKHSVALNLPHSIEWDTWKAIDGRLMTHLAFANHLEENAMDILPLGALRNRRGEIVENAPTTILELCRSLQLVSKHEALSEVRNGDYVSFTMQKGDDVTTKQDIEIPVSIKLLIPVYFGEPAVEVTAFLRRSNENGLKMGVKLQRPEQVRQDEFKRIVEEIGENVALTTVYGKPA